MFHSRMACSQPAGETSTSVSQDMIKQTFACMGACVDPSNCHERAWYTLTWPTSSAKKPGWHGKQGSSPSYGPIVPALHLRPPAPPLTAPLCRNRCDQLVRIMILPQSFSERHGYMAGWLVGWLVGWLDRGGMDTGSLEAAATIVEGVSATSSSRADRILPW